MALSGATAQEGSGGVSRSGIELTGPSDLPQPSDWYVYGANDGKQVARMRDGWGVAAVPPGAYLVTFTPVGDGAQEVRWAEVTVAVNETVTVTLDSGVDLVGRPNQGPPRDWYLFDTQTGSQVVRARNRWGFTAVPPGRYLLTLTPADGVSQQVRWTELVVAEGEVVTVEVTSGIKLAWPPEWPELRDWYVYDGTGEQIVRASGSWPYAPVPAGEYRVEVPLEGMTGVIENVQVAAGELTMIDSGLGRIEVESSAAASVISPWGAEPVDIALEQGGEVRRPFQAGAAAWAHAGPALIRYESSVLAPELPALELRVTVAANRTTRVPFEAPALAAAHGLSLFALDIPQAAADAVVDDIQVTVLDGRAEILRALTSGTPQDRWWLVGPAPVVLVRLGTEQLVLGDVPVGMPTRMTVDFGAILPAGEVPGDLPVDVFIETPADGTVVEGEFVELIGRASAHGNAQAARIVLVIDASASTNDPASIDLDGDGHSESVLAVEVAAVHSLLTELERLESETPGTAFRVALVRLSDDDRTATVVPLMAMTDPDAVAALRAGADLVLGQGPGGGTAYGAALDQARITVESDRGTGDAFILFFSDGEPEDRRAAWAAAARAGLSGMTIHTFGLGDEFVGDRPEQLSFPPEPEGGVGILALVAALGAPGGTVTPLPRPAEVLEIVPLLPILELPDAHVAGVTIGNLTTGEAAIEVRLDRDGSFEARLPVRLSPAWEHDSNSLSVTAVANDGVSEATATVRVMAPEVQEPGELVVRGAEGQSLPQLIPRVELILDSSNSMWAQIAGRSRIEIAKEVLTSIVTDLPDDAQVALRLYGHRIPFSEEGACQDSELVFPFAPLDRARLLELVDGIQPRGTTPIEYALRQVAADFAGAGGEKMVVLITDGVEECGGDPHEAVAELVASGLQVRVNIVGFALADETVKAEMERIAAVGGGSFFDASDAGELLVAVSRSLAPPFTVFDGSGAAVASGQLDGESVHLPAGTYRATVYVAGENLDVSDLLVAGGQRTIVEVRSGEGGLEVAVVGP
ncbi:MAG: VWA domain-containing protein [Trueperaceae bacterium]